MNGLPYGPVVVHGAPKKRFEHGTENPRLATESFDGGALLDFFFKPIHDPLVGAERLLRCETGRIRDHSDCVGTVLQIAIWVVGVQRPEDIQGSVGGCTMPNHNRFQEWWQRGAHGMVGISL